MNPLAILQLAEFGAFETEAVGDRVVGVNDTVFMANEVLLKVDESRRHQMQQYPLLQLC